MPETPSQHSLSELAARFELELRGDGDRLIDGVGTLLSAGPSDVTFLANRTYIKQLPETSAGAVILREADAETCPVDCLVTAEPYVAYARLANLFDPRPSVEPGIHASAVIAESASIGENVHIGANAVVGENCTVGDACALGAGTVLEDDCRLGAGCRLYANVSLGYGVTLGQRVIIHPGAVIGADGFGIAFAGDHWEKVPQLGSVTIGDDCEIGANTCIDRGAIEDTVLGDDVRIDNLCQIAHNARIGSHTAMAAFSGVVGSTVVGSNCLLGGRVAIAGVRHLEIADRTTVMAGCAVTESITEPGTTWAGHIPGAPAGKWRRTLARLRNLDKMAKRINTIENEMEDLNKHGK